MSGFLWIAQVLLAGLFLLAGFNQILFRKRQRVAAPPSPDFSLIGMRDEAAAAIAILEIAAAVCLLLPFDLLPPYIVPRLAAAALALLAVIVSVYHVRRHETAAMDMVLFLMALFVIVGRSPN
jgi:DoxX-like family